MVHEVQSSDAENEKTPSRAWGIMIAGSVENNQELTPKFLTPRYSQLETYEGKLALEAGVELRLFYNSRLKLCKAVVVAVGADEHAMTDLLRRMEAERAAAPIKTIRRQPDQKSKITDQVEVTRSSRFKLVQDEIGAETGDINLHVEPRSQHNNCSGLETTVADTSMQSNNSSVWSESGAEEQEVFHRSFAADRCHNRSMRDGLDMLGSPETANSRVEPEETIATIAAREVISETEVQEDIGANVDSSSFDERTSALISLDKYRMRAQRHMTKPRTAQFEDKLVRFMEKIREKEEALGYNQSLKLSIPKKGSKKPEKLEIVGVDFSFLNEPDAANLSTSKNIGTADAPMWVSRTDLMSLENESDSLKEYGNKLLWELLIAPADIIRARAVKQRSVGFAKLFGNKCIKALYGHLSIVRNNKARKYPHTKWDQEMPTKKHLKRVWCKAFNDRMRLSYSHDK
ncbi:hypothetical protein BV898_11304 [Hypsibius exemplaris]|uniref:Uncharacterized protein n=1 Tax=Hypsibius exemplaris TaxID=2072580 RepID=A0A1W0WH05_HYPEX|nr:hypothetical protein BV898_11304 [Hypsibius exemplaris]